jgi:hypothetical protein
VKKLKEGKKHEMMQNGDGLNITTARMCSLGYAIKKEKKRTKQNKGEIRHGTVQRALPRR